MLKVHVNDTKLCKSPALALKGLEILLDAKFTVSQTKDKVIQILQQHIKLYYDIENPALIEAVQEDQETVNDVPD